jgi:hypothetical protein
MLSLEEPDEPRRPCGRQAGRSRDALNLSSENGIVFSREASLARKCAPSLCLSSKDRRDPLMGDFETLRNRGYTLPFLNERGHQGASQSRAS